MSGDKVPIVKIIKNEIGCLSTTKGTKEWLREPNGEEEKKTLQDLVQNLERMFNEHNEYIATLRREHNGRTLKGGWTPKSGNAWDDQTTKVKNGNTSTSVSQDDL